MVAEYIDWGATTPPDEALLQLRERYPALVIVHVPGLDWYAIPIWALNTKLTASSADDLRAEIDEMIAAVPVMRFA